MRFVYNVYNRRYSNGDLRFAFAATGIFLAAVGAALGTDALQQDAGGFVAGVLGDELAGEGGAEDVFALGGGLLERKIHSQLLVI